LFVVEFDQTGADGDAVQSGLRGADIIEDDHGLFSASQDRGYDARAAATVHYRNDPHGLFFRA
jgi:hypothetical protein